MPHEVVKHACNHCKNEYTSFERALECENLPVPEPEFQYGDVINCQTEDGGIRWTYSSAQGVVVENSVARAYDNDVQGEIHIRLYVIEIDTGVAGQVWRRGVIKTDNGFTATHELNFGLQAPTYVPKEEKQS